MKAIISAACAAVLLLSGCETTKTAQNSVTFKTDKYGKVASVTLAKPSGSEAMDASLKRSVLAQFHTIVPRPLPDRTYSQPLVLTTPTTLEDYMRGDLKKTN
ncbi:MULTISPECIES: TonB C-terminal domain-containing protein [unclassified Rhizobium]|uniref:TonB C-terminal domain-containing protein n=1 Tax=unclassified Rhizobium TaxID=2613769 RepID=UPI0007E92640|nr:MULTISPECIES: TonB C-terminal domain-containing protein [unclassified Rhizobium]ANK86732.1 TonB family transporter domain-containing protein [Rhizobium sp. N731]ANL16978.1 TonB family transporter domain-containing protein [Rhizobium sp. N1314]